MENELKIDIDEWEFEFQQRDSHPVLMADQWCKSLYGNLSEEFGLDVPNYDYMFTGTSKGYVKKDHKKKLLSVFLKALENQNYVDHIFRKTLEKVDELDNFATNILKRMEGKENLSKMWKEFNELFFKIIPWFWIPWYTSEYNFFTDKVWKGLEKYKGKIESITDLNNALLVVTFPIKQNLLQKEQENFYEIVSLAKNGEDYGVLAKDYLEKYSFMKTFVELPIEPLSYEELVEKIREAIENRSFEEYKIQQSKKKEKGRIAEDILEITKGDGDLVRHIENSRKLGWLLSFSVEKSLYSLARLIPFYKKIAEKLKISYEDWIHLTIEEVRKGLKGEGVDLEEIERRKLSYVYVMENGKSQLISGEPAREKTKWIDDEFDKVDKNIREIKGHSASPGKVAGKVRVVFRAQDSRELKKGEVLVCPMTSPDYVPAMKRAAAIVTDEGSLLCHAAIVSRELGKPCVVNTKVASKILRDGDLIEVDADEGIVRIIK